MAETDEFWTAEVLKLPTHSTIDHLQALAQDKVLPGFKVGKALAVSPGKQSLNGSR